MKLLGQHQRLADSLAIIDAAVPGPDAVTARSVEVSYMGLPPPNIDCRPDITLRVMQSKQQIKRIFETWPTGTVW